MPTVRVTAVLPTAGRDEGGDTEMTETGLGIRIGSATAVAALDTDPVTSVVRRSALDLRPGAAPSLADPRQRSAGHLIASFADRVGDPVELVDDEGRSHRAEDLFATATRALVAEVCAGADCAPTVVVTHPTRWTAYTAEVLGEALDRAGLTDITLVPESVATMRWLEVTRGPQSDGLAVIYDLGASALDVTLMRTGSEAGVVGAGVHTQEFGGAQFDHAIMAYVLDTVSGSRSFEFDPFDPDTVGALVELRARCSEAKEQLSYDTSTSLTVDLPGVHTEVRLVRSEIEELVRASLSASIGVVRDAVAAAGLELTDVDQVVLVGGSTAIPLVAELLSAELRVPVVAGPRPELIVATGAAILGSDIAEAGAAEDAAAMAAVAAVAPAPIPRPTPRPAPAPAPTAPAEAGMSGRKKAGLVAGSVIVLALLAGGGLSVGTALTSENTTPAESNADTSISGTETPDITPAIAEAPATTATIDENGSAAVGSEGASTTVVNADGTVTQVDPATGAPVVGAPAAGAPAAAPAANGAASVPNIPPAAAPAAPNFQPPPAQVPQLPSGQLPSYQGPTAGDLGNGLGQSLGGVVGGVGNGLGGALGDVGNGLGGLTGR